MKFGTEERALAQEIRDFLDEIKKRILPGEESSAYALWADARNDIVDMFLGIGQINNFLRQNDIVEHGILNMECVSRCVEEIDSSCFKDSGKFCQNVTILREYADLMYMLLDCLVSDGEVFSRETINILEYCYTSQDSEELRNIARKVIKNKRKDVFDFDWEMEKVEPVYDEEAGMYYVIEQGKPMYLPIEMYPTESDVSYYVNVLHMEQDLRSPHRYINERMEVPEGAVVIDAGVAEGNFSIGIIDKVKKLYLVECDPRFIHALKWTFKDYMDKVVIVDKFLSGHEDAQCTTIDAIMQGEPLDYLKMDIEGAEVDALQGGEKTIAASPDLKCNVCVYHRFHDNEVITEFLSGHDMEVENTPGYLMFHLDEEYPYYPRKGLAQAVKKK